MSTTMQLSIEWLLHSRAQTNTRRNGLTKQMGRMRVIGMTFA